MKKRFTLIELWELLALIAILVALLLPTSGQASEKESSIADQLIDKTNAPELHTRTFKVDPNTFYMGLQNVGTLNFGATATSSGNGAKGASGSLPVLSPNRGQVGGANNANGTNGPRGLRQVTRFDSTTEFQLAVINFFNAVGVNLAAPKSVFFSDRQGTLTVRATDEDLELIEQAINTLNIVPPEVSVKVRFVEIDDEDMFKPGFEWFLKMMANNGKSAAWIAGIITEPQFKTLLKHIGQSLLQETEITTLSGRQAQIQLETNITSSANSHTHDTNNPFTLDIVPYVCADGYTIQLTLIPTETQIFGYVAPTNCIATGNTNGGIPLTGQLPLPRSRVRQVTTSCIVWDGQTAVLLLEPYLPHKKNLVIFVTSVIIDPSGNRVHPERKDDFYDDPRPRGGT